jgi:hypothetical protein
MIADAAAAGLAVGVASVLWLVAIISFDISVAGSLRWIADAAELRRVEKEVEIAVGEDVGE